MKKSISIAAALLFVSLQGIAQQPAAAKAHSPAKKPATTATAAETKPAAAASATAPTTETAEAFLKRMFGYNENIAFKVASIKPTGAAGIDHG